MSSILASSGGYNKVPQTGWLINYRNLFLTVLEVGSLRSEFWWEPSSRLQAADFSLYLHTGERERVSSLASSYKGTNPILGAPSSNLITSQSPHLQVLWHWGLGFNLWIWCRGRGQGGRNTQVQSITRFLKKRFFKKKCHTDCQIGLQKGDTHLQSHLVFVVVRFFKFLPWLFSFHCKALCWFSLFSS